MTHHTITPAHAVGSARPRAARPTLGGSFAYLALALPIGLVGSLPLLVLTLFGIATSLVWVGIPILMAVTLCWRGFARLERAWLRTTLRVDIPTPYRPAPPGSPFRRWRGKLARPGDLAGHRLSRPACAVVRGRVRDRRGAVGILDRSDAAAALRTVTAGQTSVSLPNLQARLVEVHTVGAALPYAAVGVGLLTVAIAVTPRIAWAQAALAGALLGPTAAARLAARAERLQASRARGVDAAEAERRRIERDLHDGAQQRLVAVAMTLGRARTKLDNDPEQARALIDEAHADAKQAVAELRDLARGIYPAVLGDRGLDAALSALAARCPLLVTVDVDVTPRPPTAVESTAYFIVAEALTNAAKHSAAGAARVSVWRKGNTVTVRVTDDGHGGAELRPGGGLAGLADRAATIDGTMSVLSPPGGPTVVTAELPCEW